MNVIKKIIYNNIIPTIGKLYLKNNIFVNVIYYHDIVEDIGHSYMQTNVDLFYKHMKFLYDNNYITLLFNDLCDINNIKFANNKVLITFDDGWKSNYTIVFDIMKKLILKYNIFLVGNLIDNNKNYLSWKMVREMANSEICGFGAHTFDHTISTKFNEDDLYKQVNITNNLILANTGYYPKDFCFPKGIYNQDILNMFINKTDYHRLYTSDMNYTYKIKNKIIFGRNAINNDESFIIFKNKLKGYYNVFTKLHNIFNK